MGNPKGKKNKWKKRAEEEAPSDVEKKSGEQQDGRGEKKKKEPE